MAAQAQMQAEYIHIGAHFRDLRQHYNLSIPQVAGRLHIRSKYLEAIERGDLSSLPGKVYIQGYISSYAEFLGLDPQTVLRQYNIIIDRHAPPQFRVVEPTQQRGTPAWRWIFLVAALGLVGYLLVILAGYLGGDTMLESRVDAPPERIERHLAHALLLSRYNAACLSLTPQTSLLPCYYQQQPPLLPQLRSIMELAR